MRNIFNLTFKELYIFFTSPFAYILSSSFLLLSGWFFSSSLFLNGLADLNVFFSILPVLYLFFIPALTMNSVSSEKKSGTFEHIMTFPISDFEFLISKFLTSVLILIFLLSFSLVYVETISVLGDPDFGVTISGYASSILLGIFIISIGIFSSSITNDAISAFIISFVISFIFYLLDKIVLFFPIWARKIVVFIGTDIHYKNMIRGVIDSRDVIYFLSFSLFFLYLAIASMDRRKW